VAYVEATLEDYALAYVPLSYDEHPNRVAFHRTLRGQAAVPKDGHHGQGKAA
jgi:hypothetical protein